MRSMPLSKQAVMPLKILRLLTGTSQAELAESTGLGVSTISSVETLNRRLPNLDIVTRIAEHFGLLAPHLLGQIPFLVEIPTGRTFSSPPQPGQDPSQLELPLERLTIEEFFERQAAA